MKYDIWTQDTEKRKYPQLEKDLHVDVAIIGGGLTGILNAYYLARAGKKVAVLEKNHIGSGATQFTTAFLTQSIDTDYRDLIKTFGKVKATDIVKSHQKAIDSYEQIIHEHKIECDFKRISNYVYANTVEDFATLEDEYNAAKELGVEAILHKEPMDFGFKNVGALEIKNQAKFHPLKFLYTLAEIAFQKGVLIYEETEVKDITASADISVLTTSTYSVIAKHIISATYQPFDEPLRLVLKKGMYASYVIEAEVEKGLLKEGIYEDTENPYHYVRVDAGKDADRIIIGGEDHREDIPVSKEKSLKALREYTQKLLKDKKYKIVREWDGPILEPSDGLALIGPLKNKIYYAFGFSGNGMTYAMISAHIISGYILGTEHTYSELYRADRMPSVKALITKGKDYTQELIHGALHNSLKYRKD